MLSETIKSLRKKKGMSQKQIATKLGITQGAISQWEGGLTEPGTDQLLALAEIFGVSVYYLKGIKEPKGPKKESAIAGELSAAVMQLCDDIAEADLSDDEAAFLRAQIEGIKALRKS